MFKTIVTAVRKFDTAIKRTLVTESKNVAEAVWNQFGDECSREDAAAVAKEIASDAPWKGSSSEPARVSEWKAFVFAVQYGLPEAVSYYQRTYANFTRHVLFTLARECIKLGAGEHKKAADNVAKRVKKGPTGNGASRKPTLGMGLGIIKNLPSRGKMVAFRKELAQLCKKYGYTF